jgi:hypothetical protein
MNFTYTEGADRCFRNNSVPLVRPSIALRQPTVTREIPTTNKQHQDWNQSNIINVVVDFKFIGSSGVFFALTYLSSHAFMIVVCLGHYDHKSSRGVCVVPGQSTDSENIVCYSTAHQIIYCVFASLRITY